MTESIELTIEPMRHFNHQASASGEWSLWLQPISSSGLALLLQFKKGPFPPLRTLRSD